MSSKVGMVLPAIKGRTRANASNLLRCDGAKDNFFEKVGVQGGRFAFPGDAALGRITFEETECNLAQQAQVGDRIALLNTTAIFVEADVQLPMEIVFDAPMVA